MSNLHRLPEFEDGLPSPDELTPLSQSLISPELASAFSILSSSLSELPSQRCFDVHLASQSTYATLHRLPGVSPLSIPRTEEEQGATEAAGSDGEAGGAGMEIPGNKKRVTSPTIQPQGLLLQALSVGAFSPPPSVHQGTSSPPSVHQGTSSAYGTAMEGKVSIFSPIGNGLPPFIESTGYDSKRTEGNAGEWGSATFGGDNPRDTAARRFTRNGDNEEAESGQGMEIAGEEQSARTLKRPRLVWTPQLHKRFVDAVAHLGIKNAVPKTIMQLMNVDGLTRENVASHLQKYRLYLKRMQGLSSEGPSASDQLFASTPVPPSLAASTHFLASHHRDDGLPISFPFPGLIRHSHLPPPPHINPAGPFPGFDPRAFGALSRAPPQTQTSADHRERMADIRNHEPGSQSPHILTLFPSSSR